MKNTDFTIDLIDLQTLYIHTRKAYGNMPFEAWVLECQKAYNEYLEKRENPKTYSQWVNGQILALAY